MEDSLLSCGGVRGEVVRALKTLLFGRSSQAMGKGGWYPLSFLDSRGCLWRWFMRRGLRDVQSFCGRREGGKSWCE